MSKFKLGGVPHHAHELFYRLRDKVCNTDGERWSQALAKLLELEDPREARKRLLKPSKQIEAPRI